MSKSKRAGNGEGSLFRKKRKDEHGRQSPYGNWLVQVVGPNGKLKLINLQTKDYNAARLQYQKLVAERQPRGIVIPKAAPSIREYLETWMEKRKQTAESRHNVKSSTIKRYCNLIAVLIRYFVDAGLAHLPIDKITTQHLNDYLEYRIHQTRFNNKSKVSISKEGVNREWEFYRGIFRQAYKDGVIPSDITKDVIMFKLIPKKTILPSFTEIKEVIGYITYESVRLFVTLIAHTGMRPGEVIHLRWSNLDLSLGIIHVTPDESEGWTAKNESSHRDIPVPRDLHEAFRALRKTRSTDADDGYIFLRPDGRPFHTWVDFPYRQLQKAIRAANRKRAKSGVAPIPAFTLRTLRHMFVSWALTRPNDPLTEIEIIKLVGHVDFTMLRKTYFHVNVQGETGRKMRDATLFDDGNASIMGAV